MAFFFNVWYTLLLQYVETKRTVDFALVNILCHL